MTHNEFVLPLSEMEFATLGSFQQGDAAGSLYLMQSGDMLDSIARKRAKSI